MLSSLLPLSGLTCCYLTTYPTSYRTSYRTSYCTCTIASPPECPLGLILDTHRHVASVAKSIIGDFPSYGGYRARLCSTMARKSLETALDEMTEDSSPAADRRAVLQQGQRLQQLYRGVVERERGSPWEMVQRIVTATKSTAEGQWRHSQRSMKWIRTGWKWTWRC